MTSSKFTQNLVPVEWSNQLVLVTRQVADGLNCSPDLINHHFHNHRKEFVEGVHHFTLRGAAFRAFKRVMNILHDQKSPYHLPSSVSNIKLWTCQGVARVSKLIDTPEAWQLFTVLEENYFGKAHERYSSPENPPAEEKISVPEMLKLREDVSRLRKQIKKVARFELAVVYCLLLGDGTVKIGYTKNLSERMKQVALERGEEILDYKSTPFMNLDDARALEERLKEKYAAFCLGGEYFEVLFREVCAELQTA